MIKFSHSLFALPFAGIAFILALPGSGLLQDGIPTMAFYILIAQVIICMVSLRSAAMGFNRLVDRDIDAANPRTSNREIASGQISVTSARWFIGLSLAVFIITAYTINLLCGLLAPVAAALVLGYSYTKRFTFLCHYVLGMAIGVAPTATWLAVRGEFALVPVLWSAALTLYIAGFDILYSCQDADFDREAGLYSMPSRLGIGPALATARVSHVGAAVLFVAAGHVAGAGYAFFIAAAIVGVLFIIEHSLVRPGKLDQIPIAFFHINASISAILFVGLLADYFIRGGA